MGKTHRDSPVKISERIISIKTYEKKEEVPYSFFPVESDKTIIVKKYINDIRDQIPQNIIWEIENNGKIGCQKLANFLKVKVILIIVNKSYCSPIKGTSDNYMKIGGFGGGCVETHSHTKPSAPTDVFCPNDLIIESDELSDELSKQLHNCNGVEVSMNPSDYHYLSTCEYRKITSRPMCKGCFYGSGRTTWLKGTGNKSSGKTKGRSKENDLDMSEKMNDMIIDSDYEDNYVDDA
jgi:hypothetical protein